MHNVEYLPLGELYAAIIEHQDNPRVRYAVRNEVRQVEAYNTAKKRMQLWTVQGQYRDQAFRFLGIFPELREFWFASQYRMDLAVRLFERMRPFGDTTIEKINGAKPSKRAFVSVDEQKQKALDARAIQRGNLKALFDAINVLAR